MNELAVQGIITLTATLAGVKFAMNGIRKDLSRHEGKIDQHGKSIAEVMTKVAYIEGQLDNDS